MKLSTEGMLRGNRRSQELKKVLLGDKLRVITLLDACSRIYRVLASR